jgi:predicted dinucleotide-binding enzyme
VVLDISNPYVDRKLQPLEGSSTAEEIQRWLPGARVVKGWNHVFSANMDHPDVDGTPSTVIIAGDDEAAKETVSGIARDLGFEPFDAGGLMAARSLELFHQAQAGLGFYPNTAMILKQV